ncbi:AraC family transcriptional regulator [Actinoplanes sp. L3-i22]|uniref:helix-turn-helix domain-containing protein n=1 Tax=Actinoplanes sp. L3-i22 TaxID=2836373 RepID=UPI001C853C7A|nr:AraC family transcriptional regulator [Actinoplanes sp. L3-i22]
MSRGRFTVGDGYAEYRGPATDGAAHRHAAFQIVIAAQLNPPGDAAHRHTVPQDVSAPPLNVAGSAVVDGASPPARPGVSSAASQGDVGVVDDAGIEHRGVALVVPPMVRHRLLPAADLVTFYVEPHSVFADDLRARYRDGIAAAPELHDLREIGEGRSRALDPRLVRAMRLLSERNLSMPELAAEVGLSPQRLRALARQQVGMPLPRWRVWAELRRAAEALRAGQSPAEAAVTAGFADQAHLTRRMREMVGLTPAAVLPILRAHPHPAP